MKNKEVLNLIAKIGVLFLCLSIFLLHGGVIERGALVQAKEEKTISLGWVGWMENEAAKEVAKQILEKRLGYNVNAKLADMGVIAQGLKSGNVDCFLEFCLPATHGGYWKKINQDVILAGMFYDQLSQGWVIPDYIPKDKLNSLSDLKKPEVKKKLDGKIVGITAGAGIMKQSKKALEHYGLEDDYELITGSEPVMLASLEKAIKANEWVVVTLWKPHFAWSEMDLRMLKDPDKIIGQTNSCHIVVGENFMNEFPKAYSFFARFYWGIPLIGEVMQDIGGGMSAEKAAEKFIEEHPKRVNYWVTGEFN